MVHGLNQSYILRIWFKFKNIDWRYVPNDTRSFIGNKNFSLYLSHLTFPVVWYLWSLNSSLWKKSTMRWWKKFFFIEVNIASNYIFVTMSFSRMFFVVAMQINQWCSCTIFISADNQWMIYILWHCNILNCSKTPKFHQNFDMIF